MSLNKRECFRYCLTVLEENIRMYVFDQPEILSVGK